MEIPLKTVETSTEFMAKVHGARANMKEPQLMVMQVICCPCSYCYKHLWVVFEQMVYPTHQ